MSATKHRDGHKVCGLHGRATSPVYVTDKQADHYRMLEEILRDLAKADDRFAEVIRKVAA
jgi:hypothetical protein